MEFGYYGVHANKKQAISCSANFPMFQQLTAPTANLTRPFSVCISSLANILQGSLGQPVPLLVHDTLTADRKGNRLIFWLRESMYRITAGVKPYLAAPLLNFNDGRTKLGITSAVNFATTVRHDNLSDHTTFQTLADVVCYWSTSSVVVLKDTGCL